MKSKKSSRFKFSLSSIPSSSGSPSLSSLSKDAFTPGDNDGDVTLISVKRKISSDDSGWESSTPSTSSSSSSSRKSSSNFFKIFHRSAATLLLPKKFDGDLRRDLQYQRPSRTNLFFKNEELDLERIPDSNKQTSFVTKAKRKSSKLQGRSLSAINLTEDDYEESSVISGSTNSTITSSLSPIRRHSVTSLLSSRYGGKDSYDYDSGAYSRTSTPDEKCNALRASSNLTIAAPLSAPSLVLAACMNLRGPRRKTEGNVSPLFRRVEDEHNRVSVTIGSHTKLAIAPSTGRGRVPVLGTAGLSPGKRNKPFRDSPPNGLSRSKISTVYLGKISKEKKPFCGCGEQVTVNGRHHCSLLNRSCFSDTEPDDRPSLIHI